MLLIYTYFGYPIALIVLNKLFKKENKKSEIFPSVSIIIAAYNEEKSISNKILNTLALDYPKDKVEIIVASDCSTDRTGEIVNNFSNEGIILSCAAQRRGKTAGRNRVVPQSKGEIVVFSDATGMYKPDCLKSLCVTLQIKGWDAQQVCLNMSILPVQW